MFIILSSAEDIIIVCYQEPPPGGIFGRLEFLRLKASWVKEDKKGQYGKGGRVEREAELLLLQGFNFKFPSNTLVVF